MIPTLIDASVWVDFTRLRTPRSLKLFLAPFILHPAAHLAEPVVFEVMRHAKAEEIPALSRQFQTLPLLSTPSDLWLQAATLGQMCRENRIMAGSLDLLIAAIALHHKAEIVTLDEDFQKIAGISHLSVKLLKRPAA